MNKTLLSLLLLTSAVPSFALKPVCDNPQTRRQPIQAAFQKDRMAAATAMKDVYEAEAAKPNSPLAQMTPALKAYMDTNFIGNIDFSKGIVGIAANTPQGEADFIAAYRKFAPEVTEEQLKAELKELEADEKVPAAQQGLYQAYVRKLNTLARALTQDEHAKRVAMVAHIEPLLCDKVAP